MRNPVKCRWCRTYFSARADARVCQACRRASRDRPRLQTGHTETAPPLAVDPDRPKRIERLAELAAAGLPLKL